MYDFLYVLVDDMREIHADIVLRNGVIAENMLPKIPWDMYHETVLYLDNDLGSGLEGHVLLLKMINEWKIYPDIIFIVTNNPVARKRMVDILLNDVDFYRANIETSGFHKIKREDE
jgi:hypothetical protein